MNLPVVWNCGGGVQSITIGALIVRGELPKPDYAVIADTERERSSTWLYADAVLIPELAKVGVTLHRVKKSDHTRFDLYGGKDGKTLLLPVFTNASGTVGKFSNYCSGYWKRDVIERFIRETFGLRRWMTWYGISLDELQRLRVSGKYGPNYYPLCFDNPGKPMRRAGCIQYVTEVAGWPTPPRSSCYQCPMHSPEEWLDLKENWPEDFAKAVEVERQVLAQDPNAFLHESCIPLDQVDFAAIVEQRQSKGSQLSLGCDSGFCFV